MNVTDAVFMEVRDYSAAPARVASARLETRDTLYLGAHLPAHLPCNSFFIPRLMAGLDLTIPLAALVGGDYLRVEYDALGSPRWLGDSG
jgi:hypothetical protein